MADAMPQVKQLHYHQQRRVLDVMFTNAAKTQTNSNDTQVSFSAEFLRVFSPSAEVRGHGTPVLVSNKKAVAIQKLIPVGRYAVKLVFDDGHDTGIYSWQYLHQLANEKQQLWQHYLQQLQQANANRDALIPISMRR